MKTVSRLAIFAIAVALTGVPAADVVVEAAESSSPAPTAPASPSPTTAPISDLEAIRTAPDPSTAVDIYTRARTGAGASAQSTLDLEKGYVHRMVELNVPEMCDM